MPIISKQELARQEGFAPGLEACILVDAERGAIPSGSENSP